jgi:fermentation-respiration switch protein FrsA (DUF1100 family)
MSASAPPSAPALVNDLQAIFRDRLRAVVAYGALLEGHGGARLTSLALVTTLTSADLEACAAAASKWARAGVNTPLLLPEDEFRGSLDAFPLEYGEIIRTHIVLFGHSLGSTVAVDLATRVPSAGLIVEGAPTSVTDRGAELYPYIPVRWIAGSRFDSIHKIARVKVPKLFLHAEGDEVIPIAHGRRLYAAALPPKTFVQLHGTHSDAFEVDSARYFDNIRQFLASLPSPRP